MPLKVLLPSFEYGSLEDNDYLQDRWAALLAHAATPSKSADRKPIFVEILKQLSVMDVMLLDLLFDKAGGPEDDLRNHDSLEDSFFDAVRVKHGIDSKGLGIRVGHALTHESLGGPLDNGSQRVSQVLENSRNIFRNKHSCVFQLTEINSFCSEV